MKYPPTWLYVATGRDGVRKLGSTIDPANRVVALREEYWQPFTLERTWHRPLMDARLIEAIAHASLRQYRAPERDLCWELYRAPLPVLYAAVGRAISKASVNDLSDLSQRSAFVRRSRRAAKEYLANA